MHPEEDLAKKLGKNKTTAVPDITRGRAKEGNH
jgi:hypothetical protein